MAVKKTKKIKKTITKISPSVETVKEHLSDEITAKQAQIKSVKKDRMGFAIKLAAIALIGVATFYAVKKNEGVFVAGMVNNRVVTRFELNQKLTEKYGKTVFDEISRQILLDDAAAKNKITVKSTEVAEELKKLEDQSGGKDALLKSAAAYGLFTEKDVQEYVRSGLVARKLGETLFASKITDEEVKKFFDDNKKAIGDKKLDDVKTDIKSYLIQTKLQQWLEDQKTQAKIKSFI